MKSICDQMFLSHALPDGTLLAGSGIQYGRDEDYSGGSLWYYFDLFNPDLHDGNIARFWGRFPDLNKDEKTIEFDAMLQASGFSVPTTIDPDGFIPKTPNKGISFYDSSSPAPSCVDVQPAEGIVKLKSNCPNKVGVKVLIAFGNDSECKILAPNEEYEHHYRSLKFPKSRFDGAISC